MVSGKVSGNRPVYLKVKSILIPAAGHLQIRDFGYNTNIQHAVKGTARENQARSEPEDGASPEAGSAGHPPGAADRTPPGQ